MQKIKRFSLSILYFVSFCILGLIVGVGVAYGFLTLSEQEAFSSWELLSGDLQFVKINTADNQTVWAQAVDGKVYSWNTNCYNENCNQWVEAKEIPNNEPEYYSGQTMEIGNSCNAEGRVQKAPGQVVECAHVTFSGAGFGTEVYYALMDDGAIWMWEHSANSIEMEIMPLCGGILGVIAGIIVFALFILRRATK